MEDANTSKIGELKKLTASQEVTLNADSIKITGGNITKDVWNKIYELTDLRDIQLDQCNIVDQMPQGIKVMFFLERLYITNCKNFKKFATDIYENKRLIRIDLSSNNLDKIPNDIYAIKSLQSLNLSNNQITQVPDRTINSLGQLINLEFLYLNRNNISGPMPKIIFQLKGLKSLDLEKNHINSISPDIANLTFLTEFRINDNDLRGLPISIEQLFEHKKQFLSKGDLKIYALNNNWSSEDYTDAEGNKMLGYNSLEKYSINNMQISQNKNINNQQIKSNTPANELQQDSNTVKNDFSMQQQQKQNIPAQMQTQKMSFEEFNKQSVQNQIKYLKPLPKAEQEEYINQIASKLQKNQVINGLS